MKRFRLHGSLLVITLAFLSSVQVMANQPSSKGFKPNSNFAHGPCGRHASISEALNQCGRKKIAFAHCTKSNGIWTCLPSADKTGPNSRPTGFKK